MADSHSPRTRVEGLDLLRGIAVGLVIIQHAVHGWLCYGFGLSSGVVGVVVFFALSGYLITDCWSATWPLTTRSDIDASTPTAPCGCFPR